MTGSAPLMPQLNEARLLYRTAERMEGADVHRLRECQHHQAEERDKRLVEVQHVEPLAFEQLAHLSQICRAERDGSHRAVERNAEALPDADHVALGCLLQTVAARDDAHIVATGTEDAIEAGDVVVHPPGVRKRVWRDEADFHPTPSPSSPKASSSSRWGRLRLPG